MYFALNEGIHELGIPLSSAGCAQVASQFVEGRFTHPLGGFLFFSTCVNTQSVL